MATVVKNLGRVAGLVKKSTPPENTDILWKNTSDGQVYYFDDVTGIWVPIGGATFSPIYSGQSPATVNVGGISAGYVLTGKSVNQIIQDLLVTYQAPLFTAFAMSGQAQVLEVGSAVTGLKTFTWTATNNANISGGLSIVDLTNSSNVLASGLSNDGSEPGVNVGLVSKSTPSSHVWRILGLNSQGGNFSRDFSVEWRWRTFSGTGTLPTLNEAGVEALVNSALTTGKNGTFSLAAGGYKYFAWPDSMGSPTAVTGFRDASTGFSIDMATSVDDAFFSNVQNGWYYGIVSVTNVNGITTNYRVYRSRYVLGGSISITVS